MKSGDSGAAGYAQDQQAAADAANTALPHARARETARIERKQWEAERLALVGRIESGELPATALALKSEDYEGLMWTMQQVKDRPEAAEIVALLSREFYRRRLADIS